VPSDVGWPAGGTPAGEWQTCIKCHDEIWPSEQVYPKKFGVLCAVCEVERVQAVERLAALIAQHDWDEQIFGGYLCLTCTPADCDDPDETVEWPCPPLREAGLTNEQATQIVRAHHEQVQARARAAREAQAVSRG